MKKNIKKVLSLIVFTFVLFIANISITNAACRINVSAPSNIVVGRTFNVTVTVSGSQPIGSWEYTLGYDSSKVKLNGGKLHVVDYGNGSKKSASYSYSFTALKSGSATFKPVNASVLDYASTNECLSGVGSKTVNMKTQAEIEASYSRNNNLSSLIVEGATLSPEFKSDVLEYNATLPVDSTKAIVNAVAADNTATIVGTGEIAVVDGINKIEVTVTAQHGEKKTYVINLTVEELDPIKVKVNGKDYTVVRKKGQLANIPTGFVETTIKIGEQDINAYKSDISKITVVALKDSNGNVIPFIYEDGKYKEYNEFKSNNLNLLILDNDKELSKEFKKTTFKYKDKNINGYEFLFGHDGNYYVVYAEDLETGNKDFYLLDKKENTFQRLYSDYIETKNKHVKLLLLVGGISLIIVVLSLLKKFFSLFTSKEKKIKKYQKKIDKLKNKINDEIDDDEQENYDEDESYDIDSLDDRPEIKQVEEDEYKVPKKSRKEKREEIEEAKEQLERSKKKSNKSYKRVSLEEDE